jgi:hypothetical protein
MTIIFNKIALMDSLTKNSTPHLYCTLPVQHRQRLGIGKLLAPLAHYHFQALFDQMNNKDINQNYWH